MGQFRITFTMTHHFDREGFALFSGLRSPPLLGELRALLDPLEAEEAEHHRHGKTFAMRDLFARSPALLEFAASGPMLTLARALAGPAARPTKATYFDKRPEANWSLPLHQDLTITVDGRADLPGYSHWSTKAGAPHVQPPARILEGIVALRAHLDDCPVENGALEVVPGSHLRGRISAEDLREMHRNGQAVACPAMAGDILAMRPLLVHGSGKATRPARRRVFHVEYATNELDPPLAWPRWARGAAGLDSEGDDPRPLRV